MYVLMQNVFSQSQNVKTTNIAIIGAGFGGIAMAIRLIQNQISDFIILEKSHDVGGTWRENQYPGAACDVQSHLYSFSFSPKSDWSKRYANANEIFAYIQNITAKFNLRQHCLFNTEVKSAHYLDGKWHLKLQNNDVVIAKYVILASGPLHVPKIPHIKGIEKFKGKTFHSAQWDHSYDLTHKTVASIGTGGSAIQYVPEIAKQVDQLYVFQRTAAWIIPRDDRAYLNIEKKLFRKFDWFRKLHRTRLYWSNESRAIPIFQPKLMQGAQKLAKIFIKFQVKDPVIVQKLIPDYLMGCKRILVSNHYFPTFNRPNVELVTEGIQEMTEDGIITEDGKTRKIDCLIYGTGFITDPRIYLKNFECIGENGIDLKHAWRDGAESYYGVLTRGFPNLFQLLGPNTLLAHNSVIFMIESQVEFILKLMKIVTTAQAKAIVVQDKVHDQYNEKIQAMMNNTVWESGCVSWYQQQGGKNFALWPTYTWKYWKDIKSVDSSNFRLIF